MTLHDFASWAVTIIEIAGIAVLVGGVFASAGYAGQLIRRREPVFDPVRRFLGRSILLGLELLVAADIVHTVAIDLTLTSVAVLAGIVVIRTFLSWTLAVEIEGHWPWQHSAHHAAS